jgi:hypothetical protein
MEFIEKHNLRKVHYLLGLPFSTLKQFYKSCKNEDERKVQVKMLQEYLKGIIKTRGQITKTYAYSLDTPLDKGGRLYCGNSIQSLPKAIRGFLMADTTDIDMKNAHPVILRYICLKHNLECPTLIKYINEREEILKEFEDREIGKEAFLKALNHNKINKKIKNHFFKLFDAEMKTLQQSITELEDYKDIKSSVPEYKKYNWNGSALNRILCMYENQILKIAMKQTNTLNIEIASPMFDGFMAYGNFYEDDDFIQRISSVVNSQMEGLNMEWAYKPHSDIIQMPEDYVIPEKSIKVNSNNIIANNDNDAAKKLWDKHFKNKLVYSCGSYYYKKDGIWIQDRQLIEGDIRNYVMNANIYKTNDKEELIDYGQNRKSADNITKTVLDIALSNCDNNWVSNIFHSSLGKILFNNGYYDFRKGKFCYFEDEDFDTSIIFTQKISFDMKFDFTETDYDYINSIRERIFYSPFGTEVGDYYLLLLARGLAGDCMKRFLVGIGSSNTGKSLLSSALKSSCGGYQGSWNGANLAYKPNSSADEAAKLRWVLLLRHKRIIVSSELTMGAELDGNMIKKLSNGGLDDITARNHCEGETSFKIGFLPVLFANDIDRITPKDDAVVTRLRAINYEKVYVEEPSNEYELQIDYNMGNEVETYEFKVGFLMLMFQAYKVFQDGGRVEFEPEGIKKSNKDIVGAEISIIDSFKADFEITNDEEDYVKSSDVDEWLVRGKYKVSMTKFGLEMNKYVKINNLENVKTKLKKLKKPIRVWSGIKMINEVEGDEDC